jgi:hypothetical protein
LLKAGTDAQAEWLWEPRTKPFGHSEFLILNFEL